MKPSITASLLLAAIGATACVTQEPLLQKTGSASDASGWTCSARGLIVGRYAGGDEAVIQVLGDKQAASYPVRPSMQGDAMVGITARSVPFTCKRR